MKWIACTPAKSLQLRPTLCDPTDHSPPGSSVQGILQARMLERAAMPFSRGSSRPREPPSLMPPALAGGLIHQQCHLGSPVNWKRTKPKSLMIEELERTKLICSVESQKRPENRVVLDHKGWMCRVGSHQKNQLQMKFNPQTLS